MAKNRAARVTVSAAGDGFFDLLSPGLYAWGVTVAWPVSQRFAPPEARIAAYVALAALVAGAILARFWPTPARIAGTWIFLAACVTSWALFSPAIAPSQLDPVQGVLGSLGWALFAIAWGGQKAAPLRQATAATAVAAPVLKRPPAQTRAALGLGILATVALVPMALAWWVMGTERALLAHAVTLAAAIAFVAPAVDLLVPASSSADAPRWAAPKKRWRDAAPSVIALLTLALAGAAIGLVR